MNKWLQIVPLAIFLSLTSAARVAVAEGDETAFQTQYIEMKPSFVTNFGQPGNKKLKFVKADVSLRVTTRASADAVEHHMAYLRNEIVFLLSSQAESAMISGEGQETVRQAALKSVNAFLRKEADGAMVDDLLFTNFVVQR
ncbi:flagellar basal body-associated protein FliL-like protein [Oleiphilus messinensis]|uniref:Flagellar protein FliL n=1 Tax=Oleiphilus messinensis TaxID=141451 RepID=A0A1Y0I1S5_9GAMM|nr:flagellar basal body-associated FliL family protein [Oleiphilus messinensis]ARU54210.1 flagellar basal body-associated protein FliL-like protein [Oleiphilus messinensis]